MLDEKICNEEDEILEIIWMLKESGKDNINDVRERMREEKRLDEIADMEKDGLVKIDGEKVVLTGKGEEKARNLIRRHRLAERLLVDVLGSPNEEIESSACQFEHILSDDVVDNICTLLGHPKECVHGLPIPSGKCCQEAKTIVESIIVPLSKLSAGEESHVAYILTKNHPNLHKLMSFGILPGVKIKIHQKSPSCVINVGETQIALEGNILENIYVRK